MPKVALDLSATTKSKIVLSTEAKPSDLTWDEMNMTWEEQDGTWEQPEFVLTKESKTKVPLSLKSK